MFERGFQFDVRDPKHSPHHPLPTPHPPALRSGPGPGPGPVTREMSPESSQDAVCLSKWATCAAGQALREVLGQDVCLQGLRERQPG